VSKRKPLVPSCHCEERGTNEEASPYFQEDCASVVPSLQVKKAAGWNIGGIMEAFEFEATHKNGMIKIPDELRKNLTKKIQIIILTEEKKKNALSKLLLDAPTWDESDVMDFQQTIREGYKNWKIEEF
jgi:hypothetical protein